MQNDGSLEKMLKQSSLGDKDAFRAVFEHTQKELFAFIRSRTAAREDAFDLIQETLVDLWMALKNGNFTYSSDSEFRGFLYTIARKKIARYYRFRRVTISLENLDDILLDESDNYEPGEKTLLMEALNKLNKEDQEVVRLKHFSGLSFKEIAELLKREESAVRVRHHRALGKLREILGYEK